MPNYFQRLGARTNRVFARANHGAERFFSRTIPKAADTVAHGITKTANQVGSGIERGVKAIQKSGALADALAIGGAIAAPFSGGMSLALEAGAIGSQAANDMRRHVKNGKAAYQNAVAKVNDAARRGIQKAALSTRSGLMSLADSVPVASSQMGNNGPQQLAGDDLSSNTILIH
eukprot:gene27304-32980_t